MKLARASAGRPIRALIGVIHLSRGTRGCVTPSKVGPNENGRKAHPPKAPTSQASSGHSAAAIPAGMTGVGSFACSSPDPGEPERPPLTLPGATGASLFNVSELEYGTL